MIVLHVVPLSNITNNACVVPLRDELKRPNSKSITRLEVMLLLLKQHLVQPTRCLTVHVEVSHDNGARKFIIVNFKVLVTYLLAYDLYKISLLSCLLVLIRLAKDDRH